MSALHKINFVAKDYENIFVYKDELNYEKKEKFSVFKLPQTKDFLTIFVLLDELNETNRTLLVNCITSIKVQSFSNIEIVIVNMDCSRYAHDVLSMLESSINLKIVYSSAANVSVALDNLVKNCKSEYVSIINFSDIIPRIGDVEFVVITLFERGYDYLTLSVDYFDNHGKNFDFQSKESSVLKSNLNFHYSAYFKTEILRQYKFSELRTGKLDEGMIMTFEDNEKRGNHIKSKTQMNFLAQFESIN